MDIAGIYIHVPFCRKACRYCDFYFMVSLQYRDAFVDALQMEIGLRSDYLAEKEVGSIYFGGGTPSVLTTPQIDRILNAIHAHFRLSEDMEQTMEANPDDLTAEYLAGLKTLSFNRLSIGVQSFHGRDLELMNRSHDENQSEKCIRSAAEKGFSNINMDLIYGIPGMSGQDLEVNLERTMTLPVQHISAYHLTFEQGTVFDHWRKLGRISEVQDEESGIQYEMVHDTLTGAGFEHYEISNFAKEKMYSRHNNLYWTGKPYLGLGPSAHSYNKMERAWNVTSLKKYMAAMKDGSLPLEHEQLGPGERYHDYLITNLRTSAGIALVKLEQEFGKETVNHFREQARRLTDSGSLVITGSQVTIPPERWIMADGIIRELMLPS